jgi:hypothetical protein
MKGLRKIKDKETPEWLDDVPVGFRFFVKFIILNCKNYGSFVKKLKQ